MVKLYTPMATLLHKSLMSVKKRISSSYEDIICRDIKIKIMATPKSEKDLHLPLSRVKTIMKSSPDVEAVGAEPLYLVTKVTELFVTDLAKRAIKNSKNSFLEYKHIAQVVQSDDTLDFLREIMPKKITVRQYKEMMAKKAAKISKSDDTTEESSEEESSEESSDNNEQDT